MRRHSVTLLLILLACLLVGGMLWHQKGWLDSDADSSLTTSVLPLSAAPASEDPAIRHSAAGAVKPAAVAAQGNADPSRYRRAYMLMLDRGHLSLEDTTDIEGDFALSQGKPDEWSGMLRCRLLDPAGKVLAEEVMAAPDYLCTVLDAREGEPKPVKLTAPGPVVFQVRLPRVKEAAKLDITRITGAGSLNRDLPVGTIALSGP